MFLMVLSLLASTGRPWQHSGRQQKALVGVFAGCSSCVQVQQHMTLYGVCIAWRDDVHVLHLFPMDGKFCDVLLTSMWHLHAGGCMHATAVNLSTPTSAEQLHSSWDER
jgi:hypothetical protein